jgi:hypothetical protein
MGGVSKIKGDNFKITFGICTCPVRDKMSVENNFYGFTACRRYAMCKGKYTFRTYGTKRTPMRVFLPTYCAYGTKKRNGIIFDDRHIFDSPPYGVAAGTAIVFR